jgi:hypothetical protein
MSDTSDNLPEVVSALQAWQGRFDTAAGQAVSLIARQIFIDAKKNADSAPNPPVRVTAKSGRKYYKYGPHIGPRSGEGPNRGTGNLLTSMTFSSSRQGFGTYTAQVGAGAIYARQLELGGGKWPSGVKYPYMQPALTSIVTSGKLSQILAYSFRSLGG